MTAMYSGLHTGQPFVSLEEFKTVVRSISVRQHWELRVTRSNKKSVVIGCRSSANCTFRVVCRANKNATYITSLTDSHTCRRNEVSPGTTPARSEASHVRFLLSEIPKLFDMKSKIKGQDVVDAVKRYHGHDISMRQAQRALTKLQPRESAQGGEASGQSNTRSVQDTQQPHPQSQDIQPGPPYSSIPEQRWIPEEIQPELINFNQTQAQRSPAPPQVHVQSVPHPPALHHNVPVQTHDQAPLNQNIAASNSPQNFARSTPNQIHPTQPKQPDPPSQQPGHPHTAQLVLSNFKIEFTCTTCGAPNQSFIPNHGNITGNYLSQPAPETAAPRTVRSSSQAVPGSSPNIVSGANEYGSGAASSARAVQPWPAGALEVPMAPAHS